MGDDVVLPQGTTAKESIQSWVFRQGPAVAMLGAILWWLNGQAPAIIQGLVSSIVEKQDTRHERQLESVTKFVEAERTVRTSEIKELTRTIDNSTKAVGDLVNEFRRTRHAPETGSGS